MKRISPKTVNDSTKFKLYAFEEVEDYLQDNDFIRTGYRANYSYRESWSSFFRIHNESGNVWTHSAGFLIFFGLLWHAVFADLHKDFGYQDRMVLVMFLLCTIFTMLCSSLFHLHLCVSERDFNFWGCFDYAGISISIAGATIAIMYFLLHCESNIRLALVFLIIAVNMVGLLGPMYDKWNTPEFRTCRAAIYSTSALLAVFPVAYFFCKYGPNSFPSSSQASFYFVITIAQYALGAFIYVHRFPERYAIGKFDYIGHSHQIWHTLVLTATLCLYRGIIGLMVWKLDNINFCQFIPK
ncbi:hypothetical protein HDV04_000525 [Boothiomyces sp. JEL0838]|nr:hypothetical protein HDV04_000525 [Boothiomyces sp. JEL0838]